MTGNVTNLAAEARVSVLQGPTLQTAIAAATQMMANATTAPFAAPERTGRTVLRDSGDAQDGQFPAPGKCTAAAI